GGIVGARLQREEIQLPILDAPAFHFGERLAPDLLHLVASAIENADRPRARLAGEIAPYRGVGTPRLTIGVEGAQRRQLLVVRGVFRNAERRVPEPEVQTVPGELLGEPLHAMREPLGIRLPIAPVRILLPAVVADHE